MVEIYKRRLDEIKGEIIKEIEELDNLIKEMKKSNKEIREQREILKKINP